MKGTLTNGDVSIPVHDVEVRTEFRMTYWVAKIGNEDFGRGYYPEDGWTFEEETPRTMDVIKALEPGTLFTGKSSLADRQYIRLFGNEVYDDRGYTWNIDDDFGPDMKEKIEVIQ